MGRKHLKIESLYGETIENLIELKNTIESKYSRTFLTVIIMRYFNKSTPEIMAFTGLSNPTIVRYIVDWNKLGMKAIVDHRGGSDSKLEPSIVEDIVYVVSNKTPIDFAFTAHTWTCALLSYYVEQTYGIRVCQETIRQVLLSHGISYKRAQPKPTKADIKEQEEFKKNARSTEYFRVFI